LEEKDNKIIKSIKRETLEKEEKKKGCPTIRNKQLLF